MSNAILRVYMPAKSRWVMSQPSRYKVLYGGRGGAKSYSFADMAIARTVNQPLRFLCTRETQNSIRDSVHRLLSDRINTFGFSELFTIRNETIESRSGAQFFFKGLHHNISEVKSMEGIDICWVEEAEKVKAESWDTLIPTIRKQGSEIWISFNPDDEKSATYQRFIKHPPPDARIACLTWRDNKFFPEVLMRELEYDKRVDFEKYEHVWEGKCKRYSDALVFKGKIRVESFETPSGVQLYFGADFGFSVDPSVLVRMFIADHKLFIDYEAYGVGVELTDLHQFFGSVPESNKWRIVADSQRPDTISFLSQYYKGRDGTDYPGYDIVGAEKGKGSVEDGIQFLRGFEQIIIHPRCRGAVDNFTNYKWKQDRITQEVLPLPLDASNHVPDACRYALESYIKSKASIFDIDYSKLNVLPV